MKRREGRRFPYLPLVQLSVADQGVGLEIFFIEAARQRAPDGNRQSLPERARGRLDAGQTAHVGMPLERTSQLAQGQKKFGVEITRTGQRRVKRRATVSLGKNEAVAVRPFGIFGVVA